MVSSNQRIMAFCVSKQLTQTGLGRDKNLHFHYHFSDHGFITKTAILIFQHENISCRILRPLDIRTEFED